MAGARRGAFTSLRRLLAFALARELDTFVVPGPEIAAALGLNLAGAGLRLVPTPRHASVLLVIGALPAGLRDAVCVAYAQMPRPRTILLLGAADLAPLPAPDVAAPLSRDGLLSGVAVLRRAIEAGAFGAEVADFSAPVLQTRTQYTCPMHPEIVSDQPGNCPKCGMELVARETQMGSGHSGHINSNQEADMTKDSPTGEHQGAGHGEHKAHADDKPAQYTCPMHPEVVSDQPGSCPKCGMFLEPVKEEKDGGHDHSKHGAHTAADDDDANDKPAHYTCPMHPEVVSSEPGSCPKCGMFLVPVEKEKDAGHAGHGEHSAHATAAADDDANDKPAQYTCPMHPEVVSDQPGSCPKCGMFLVPVKEDKDGGHAGHGEHSAHTAAADDDANDKPTQYTCPMHPEVVSDKPGSCPKCGMFLEPVKEEKNGGHDHAGHGHAEHKAHAGSDAAQYTCPMHPEVVSDKPGSCPKCGMFLVPVEKEKDGGHAGHGEHSAHASSGVAVEGIEAHFMSMVDVTRDLEPSGDGLRMDWIKVPFGPFFPGLAAGLKLDLTLDGDTVATSDAASLVGYGGDLVAGERMEPEAFVARLEALSPLSPVAYRHLACAALEDAASKPVSPERARSRVGALERERVASHLGWLVLFARQTGFGWLGTTAAALQREVLSANAFQIGELAPSITKLIRRLHSTPLLHDRLFGIGRLSGEADVNGPVGRSNGTGEDARAGDATYAALGFVPLGGSGGDALARFNLRLDEIKQSLELIAAAGSITRPKPAQTGAVSGSGEAVVETPRGPARLQLSLEHGKVSKAELETPSASLLNLIGPLSEHEELGDALTAIASLDLSPWEVRL